MFSGLVALGRAMLAGDLARPALGEREAVAEHRDRPPPPGRAQKFPFAISLSARFSRVVEERLDLWQ